ncbi:MAG: hypothetical protein ACRD22_09825 [Terriglobia bacterium]
MAYCSTSLLARSVAVDPFTNTITAIDIAENLTIEVSEAPTATEKAPYLIQPFRWVFIALLWRDDASTPESDITGRLVIVSPQGREFPGPEQRLDLVDAPNGRVLTMIPAFPYTGNGPYRFCYQVLCGSNWQPVSEFIVPLTITTNGAETDRSP